jgi:hypothetical protein
MTDATKAFGPIEHPGQRRAQLLVIFYNGNGRWHLAPFSVVIG